MAITGDDQEERSRVIQVDTGHHAEPPGARSQRPLSLLLRQESAADHVGLEHKIGPMQDSLSRDRYATMLLMFKALHGLTEALHETFSSDYETHGFAAPRRGLDAAIDRDLAALGWPQKGRDPVAIPLDPYPAFAQALGAVYVAEGSALGNALLLRQAETWGEATPGAATAFLSESASQSGARFRAFRSRLDAFGLERPDAHDAVLDGARHTFRACGALIDALR
jgi:heme oxygenase